MMINNYYYTKMIHVEDLRTATMPCSEAISFLNFVCNVAMSERLTDAIEVETMISLLYERPRDRVRVIELLSKPIGNLEHRLDFFDRADNALDRLRILGSNEVSIQQIMEAHLEACEIEREMREMTQGRLPGEVVSPAIDGNPMHIGMPLGNPTPPGASRSDPIIKEHAHNLWQVHYAAQKAFVDGRRELVGDSFGFDPHELAQTLGPAEARTIMITGHLFREKFPWLGYDCWPLALPDIGDKLMDIMPLYAEVVRKNMSSFFRYPKLFEIFGNVFTNFVRKNKRIKGPEREKMRILYMGARTLDEPLSLVLLAKQCLERFVGLEDRDVRNWLEIEGINWDNSSTEAIRAYCEKGEYPIPMLDKFPGGLYDLARRNGWITVKEDSFTVSAEIRGAINQIFLNLLDPSIKSHQTFASGQYHAVFNLKTFEYLIEMPRSVDQFNTAQWLIDHLDRGNLLRPDGTYYTDGTRPDSHGLRLNWTLLTYKASHESITNALVRRLPGLGEMMTPVIGPVSTIGNDMESLLRAGEIMIPMLVPELRHWGFWKPMWEEGTAETAAYRLLNGQTVKKNQAKQLRTLAMEIMGLEQMMNTGFSSQAEEQHDVLTSVFEKVTDGKDPKDYYSSIEGKRKGKGTRHLSKVHPAYRKGRRR